MHRDYAILVIIKVVKGQLEMTIADVTSTDQCVCVVYGTVLVDIGALDDFADFFDVVEFSEQLLVFESATFC
jgi:hypothetical protein